MTIQDGSITKLTHKYQQTNNKLDKKVLAKFTTSCQEIKDTPQSPASNGVIDLNAKGTFRTKAYVVVKI